MHPLKWNVVCISQIGYSTLRVSYIWWYGCHTTFTLESFLYKKKKPLRSSHATKCEGPLNDEMLCLGSVLFRTFKWLSIRNKCLYLWDYQANQSIIQLTHQYFHKDILCNHKKYTVIFNFPKRENFWKKFWNMFQRG